jgi:hypothetical protein
LGRFFIGDFLIRFFVGGGREGAGGQAAGRDGSGSAASAASDGLTSGEAILVVWIVAGRHDFSPPLT